MDSKEKYDNFINQFATSFNEIANDAIASLSSIGINITKSELLTDLFNNLTTIDEKDVSTPKTKNAYSIAPTTNKDDLPKQAIENLISFMENRDYNHKTYIVEVVRIKKDNEFYAVEYRSISSNFTTHYFTEQEFIEIINKPKVITPQQVFSKKKTYQITIK